MDVLTSVSGVRGMPGKVICYEVPEKTSFDKGTWKKHILSTDFSASQNYRTISPGGVYAFYPGKKVVAGDQLHSGLKIDSKNCVSKTHIIQYK